MLKFLENISYFDLFSGCPGFDFNDFELLRNKNHISRLDKAINDLI